MSAVFHTAMPAAARTSFVQSPDATARRPRRPPDAAARRPRRPPDAAARRRRPPDAAARRRHHQGRSMPESTHISPGEGVNLRLGAPQPTSLEERKSPLASTVIMQVLVL